MSEIIGEQRIPSTSLQPVAPTPLDLLQTAFKAGWKPDEIAAKLGKSRETVANTMRLLDLPEYIQDALQKGGLSESHARLLLAVEDPAAQKQLFDDIAEHGLTTRDVKERVKRFSGGVGHRGRPSLAEMEANLPPEMRAMQDELSSSLGAPVQIQKGAGNGKITITFYSEEELGNILRKLGMQEG